MTPAAARGARSLPIGWAVVGVIGVTAVVLVIASRNAGLYPVVLDDEYRYSIAARLLPFAQSVVPNYLFSVVYRSTSVCGDAFLTCGRWLNLVFFAAATPSIYCIARRVASPSIATLVAALALVGPFSTYTAYFMPESMYYFGFWLTAALVLSVRPDAASTRYALVGSLLGALALVKPHALFLLPPVIAFLAIETWREHRFHRARIATQAVVVLASAFATKFAIGAAIAGRPALTLFGSFYSGIAATARTPAAASRTVGLAADVAWNLSGHLMALTLLFALPVATLVSSPFARASLASRAASERRRLLLFTGLVFGVLIVMTTSFTAAVDGQGPYETLARLHARYYDFAFPLLVVVGVASTGESVTRPLRVVVALLAAATVAFAALRGLQPFGNGMVDYPELQGITARASVKYATACLGLVSLALWSVRPRHAALWFVLAVMPFAMLKGSISVSEQLHGRRVADAYDIAGSVARHAIARDDAARAIVFGDDAAGVYRTLFQLDAATASAKRLEAGTAIGAGDWPASRPWAIVVGDHRIDGIDVDRFDHDGFALLHRRSVTK